MEREKEREKERKWQEGKKIKSESSQSLDKSLYPYKDLHWLISQGLAKRDKACVGSICPDTKKGNNNNMLNFFRT